MNEVFWTTELVHWINARGGLKVIRPVVLHHGQQPLTVASMPDGHLPGRRLDRERWSCSVAIRQIVEVSVDGCQLRVWIHGSAEYLLLDISQALQPTVAFDGRRAAAVIGSGSQASSSPPPE